MNRRWLLLIAIAFAGLPLAFALDETVWRYVHEHFNENTRPIPPLLKLPHRLLRSLENWGENVFIVIILYAMWVLDPKHRHRVLNLLLAVLIVSLSVEGIKRLAGRERPETSLGKTIFHGTKLGATSGDYQSFPSGHVASAASYSGSLAAFYPPLRPAVLFLAAGTGASRIWKERHYLSDVWAAGWFGFLLAHYLGQPSIARAWKNALDAKLAPRSLFEPT